MTNFSDHKGVCGIYMMYRQPAEQISEGKIVGNRKKITLNPNLVWFDILSQGNCINLGKVCYYQTISRIFYICNGNYTQVVYDIHYNKEFVSFSSSEVIVDPRSTKELKVTVKIKDPNFAKVNGEYQKLKEWNTSIKFEPRSIS